MILLERDSKAPKRDLLCGQARSTRSFQIACSRRHTKNKGPNMGSGGNYTTTWRIKPTCCLMAEIMSSKAWFCLWTEVRISVVSPNALVRWFWKALLCLFMESWAVFSVFCRKLCSECMWSALAESIRVVIWRGKNVVKLNSKSEIVFRETRRRWKNVLVPTCTK